MHWLEDYALFRTLKAKFEDAYYLEWPTELVQRKPVVLDRVRRELANEIGQVCFAQFLLFRQGERLKAHAHSKGLGLIGDLPFFVSPDSSDVWVLGRGDSPLSQPMVELKLYPLHGCSLLYISLAASFPWLTILDWSCGLDRLEQFRR